MTAGVARRRTAVLVGLVLAAAPALQVAGMATAAAPTPKILVQNVGVAWAGADYKGGSTATAVIPGIGSVALICKRDTTMIRLTATDRTAENQMWMAKYETKNGEQVVAVKNARIYKYANRNDTSGSGTSASAHEGLNQLTNIENASSGYIHGVISRRVARTKDAAAASTAPSTSFNLNWYWNGFRKDAKDSSCSISAKFITNVTNSSSSAKQVVDSSRSKTVKLGSTKKLVGRKAAVYTRGTAPLSINWHGDEDAANAGIRTATIAGIGQVSLACEQGTDGAATITLDPDPDADANEDNTSAHVETVTGEGEVVDHVEDEYPSLDPETGLVGPVDLPVNGMMRIYYDVAGKKTALIVSSYRKRNDPKAELNLCEVATALWAD